MCAHQGLPLEPTLAPAIYRRREPSPRHARRQRRAAAAARRWEGAGEQDGGGALKSVSDLADSLGHWFAVLGAFAQVGAARRTTCDPGRGPWHGVALSLGLGPCCLLALEGRGLHLLQFRITITQLIAGPTPRDAAVQGLLYGGLAL